MGLKQRVSFNTSSGRVLTQSDGEFTTPDGFGSADLTGATNKDVCVCEENDGSPKVSCVRMFADGSNLLTYSQGSLGTCNAAAVLALRSQMPVNPTGAAAAAGTAITSPSFGVNYSDRKS